MTDRSKQTKTFSYLLHTKTDITEEHNKGKEGLDSGANTEYFGFSSFPSTKILCYPGQVTYCH